MYEKEGKKRSMKNKTMSKLNCVQEYNLKRLKIS